MLKLSNILDIVSSYHPHPDLDIIRKAYVCSAKYHAGQVRKSGEPYLSHPLEVAKILAELKLDEASICTGLLHDTVEDTQATKEDIEELFGKDIANLVDGVTKLSQIKFYSTEEKQAENFSHLVVGVVHLDCRRFRIMRDLVKGVFVFMLRRLVFFVSFFGWG